MQAYELNNAIIHEAGSIDGVILLADAQQLVEFQ